MIPHPETQKQSNILLQSASFQTRAEGCAVWWSWPWGSMDLLCTLVFSSPELSTISMFSVFALEVWPYAPTDQEVGQWMLCLLILPLSYDTTPASWGLKYPVALSFCFLVYLQNAYPQVEKSMQMPPSPCLLFLLIFLSLLVFLLVSSLYVDFFFFGTRIHSLMPKTDLIPNSTCLLTD